MDLKLLTMYRDAGETMSHTSTVMELEDAGPSLRFWWRSWRRSVFRSCNRAEDEMEGLLRAKHSDSWCAQVNISYLYLFCEHLLSCAWRACKKTKPHMPLRREVEASTCGELQEEGKVKLTLKLIVPRRKANRVPKSTCEWQRCDASRYDRVLKWWSLNQSLKPEESF